MVEIILDVVGVVVVVVVVPLVYPRKEAEINPKNPKDMIKK